MISCYVPGNAKWVTSNRLSATVSETTSEEDGDERCARALGVAQGEIHAWRKTLRLGPDPKLGQASGEAKAGDQRQEPGDSELLTARLSEKKQ